MAKDARKSREEKLEAMIRHGALTAFGLIGVLVGIGGAVSCFGLAWVIGSRASRYSTVYTPPEFTSFAGFLLFALQIVFWIAILFLVIGLLLCLFGLFGTLRYRTQVAFIRANSERRRESQRYLVGLLSSDRKDLQDVVDTLRDIADFSDKSLIEPLVYALVRENLECSIRKQVASNLQRLGWVPHNDLEAVWYLIGVGEYDKLVRFGELSVGPLVVSLRGNDRVTRESAARALGEIGDEKAIEPLTHALLEDKTSEVAEEARKALEKIGSRKTP